MITVDVQTQDINAILVDFDQLPGRVTRATIRAMNRAIASGRAEMSTLIADDTGLRVTDVRKALTVSEASVERPQARLATTLKRIPLIKFGARGPRPSRGRGEGVSYRLRGSAGRVATAFIATMRSGHEGVFVRSGGLTLKANQFKGYTRKRLPIRELFGPSLGHVFAKHRPAGMARIRESFDKNLAHELDFALKGSNA